MYVCLSVFPKKKTPPPRRGSRAARHHLSSFSLSLFLSRASTLESLNPEFRNARVCRPPSNCMYGGAAPPCTQLEGSLHTLAFLNSGFRNARVLSLSLYVYIYIPIRPA